MSSPIHFIVRQFGFLKVDNLFLELKLQHFSKTKI